MPNISSVIFGLEGYVLKEDELSFFREVKPLGYILFARNINNPDQLRALNNSLRAISGDPNTPILIDQEGGRVQRLRPPYWRDAPPASTFGALWDLSPEKARRSVELNTLLIAAELNDLGIDVNCAPLLDVPIAEVTKAIGNRAFHANPLAIIELARVQIDTFLENGILPIIKHIPGHGRATSDSHFDLPIVDSSSDILEKSDFEPFRALNNCPLGMTAHIVYKAFDRDLPATLSNVIISDVIRNKIGFDGLLLTDDLSMKALTDPFSSRARKCLDAGCDIVLHCNGDMGEMRDVAKGLCEMTTDATRRWDRALKARQPAKYIDVSATLNELSQLLA